MSIRIFFVYFFKIKFRIRSDQIDIKQNFAVKTDTIQGVSPESRKSRLSSCQFQFKISRRRF